MIFFSTGVGGSTGLWMNGKSIREVFLSSKESFVRNSLLHPTKVPASCIGVSRFHINSPLQLPANARVAVTYEADWYLPHVGGLDGAQHSHLCPQLLTVFMKSCSLLLPFSALSKQNLKGKFSGCEVISFALKSRWPYGILTVFNVFRM